jgi:hypothetical protein
VVTAEPLSGRPAVWHLPLIVGFRGKNGKVRVQTFLGGHDERARFATAVREAGGVLIIRTATKVLYQGAGLP